MHAVLVEHGRRPSPSRRATSAGDDALGLIFTGPVLERTARDLRQPCIELELEVDKPTAFVCVRLCEVQPDGASTLVSYGLLNLTHDAPTRRSRRWSPAAATG